MPRVSDDCLNSLFSYVMHISNFTIFTSFSTVDGDVYGLFSHFSFFHQEMNFISEGSVLHYGQKVEDCTLGRLWDELKSSCDFINAQNEVEIFNRHNRWKKRGIAMVPTKFGIAFTFKSMNQVHSFFFCTP